ncbi:hypothetical protein BYT27DRAFT_7209227 [Phlegmacium glaucopus]|nr:hypothetical protein BYT27DRAFT_7209227 [Phlegmacium glaucopus]
MPDSHFNSCKGNTGFKGSNHSISHRCEAQESVIKPNNIRLIIAYDVLHIFGLMFILAILLTAWFSSSIRRSTGWYSLNCAWVLSCIGYLLILGHQTGPLPGHIHCLFQAMLINSLPALTEIAHRNALTFVTFMLEFYFVPYGVFTGILIENLILGILHPTAVLREPHGYFCYFAIWLPVRITSAIVICSLIACLILGVRIILKCRNHWKACNTFLIRGNTSFGFILRFGVVVSEILNWVNVVSLSLAAFPVVVGIMFGSQDDMLRVWMFWRKPLPTLTTATV